MEFVAVLRARSRAKVRREDPNLVVMGLPSPIGPLTIVVRTRYDEAEFGIPVPRELWVEVRGEADTLDQGVDAAGRAAASLVPVLALTANAAIGDLEPHLAFETTNDTNERAFFQSTVEDERGMPPPGRRIPIELTVELLDALGHSRENARLLRASNQYLLALRYWKRHHGLLCLSHLFMAAETLKVVALRTATDQIALEPLAKEWGIRLGEPRTRQLLEAEARRLIVFHGDGETESRAREISDGFEHGYSDFGDLHGPAASIRPKTAQHVRAAILELSGLRRDAWQELGSGRHATPLEMDDYARYLRGHLVGEGAQLAADGEEYPFLEWTSKPSLAAAGEEGAITISGSETFTVRTADAISFRAESYELWGPRSDSHDSEEAPTASPEACLEGSHHTG
jgi:hypothetical protein